MKTKIFLDSGSPEDTKEAIRLLGFLDGQTTNPSLIAKNTSMQEKKQSQGRLTHEEVNAFYKKVIQDIYELIPEGSISIEVAADATTSAEDMLRQAREMNTWIPTAHIKFPTTESGLEAARTFVQEGGRVNMTLVFSQDQAAAIHVATKGAKRGDVFVSPFIGRLDDKGQNGIDLIKNIGVMYRKENSHVEILAASVRSLDHFLACLALETDIITAPLSVLQEWATQGKPLPTPDHLPANQSSLASIPYKLLDLTNTWSSFDMNHPLTSAGIEKFAADWNNLLQ